MSLPEDIPSTERDFVELATRPLAAQPEARNATQVELLGQLARVDPAKRHALLERAVACLGNAGTAPGHGMMKWLVIVWLLLAAIAAWQAFAFSQEGRNRGTTPRKFPRPTAEQRSFSDPSELEDYLVKEGKIPPDFHEIWTRLDPDNGSWAWFEALSLATAEGYRSDSEYGPTWPDERFARIWKLVEQAAEAPRFEWYFPPRHAERQSAAGAGDTVLSIACQIHQNRLSEESVIWSLVGTSLFSERAARMLITRDMKGLRETVRVWEALILRIGTELATVEDAANVNSLLWMNNVFFRAAQDLAPLPEAKKLIHQSEPLWAAAAVPSFTDQFGCGPAVPRESVWSWGQFLRPNDVYTPEPERGHLAREMTIHGQSTANYEAGRLAEYTMAERMLGLAAATFLLVLMLLAWLTSRLQKARIRGLAEGLAPLFDKRDWLWLLGLGLLAPLAWYWVITRLTPWGGRELGGSGVLLFFQAIATLLLAVTLIEQVTRWRVARRTLLIGISSRWQWLGWGIALFLAAAVLLSGVFQGFLEHAYKAGRLELLAGVGLILLLILGKGIVALLPLGRPALLTSLHSRVALPVMAAAAALLLGSYPVLLTKEKNLLARDPVTGWDASRGTTRCQGAAMERVNARCLALWNERQAEPPPGK